METYTKADLVEGLTAAGLVSGDLVLVQSQLYGLGRPAGVNCRDDLPALFLEALLEVLGAEGTLVVPTFTTQVARHDLPYVVEETVPNYGLFGEYVFRHPDFVRSRHPMWSLASTGRLKHEICRAEGTSNFGARSPFDELVRRGAKNVFVGVEIRKAATLAHYAEMHYGVPHIYNKVLKWRPVESGVPSSRPFLAGVRYLEFEVRYDLAKFQEDLFARGAVREAAVGGGRIWAVGSEDFLETAYDGLERDPYYFLAAPPEFDYGRMPYEGASVPAETVGVAGADAEDSKEGRTARLLAAQRAAAPHFVELVGAVLEKSSPAMRGALARMLDVGSEVYFAEGEVIVEALYRASKRRGMTREKLVESYLRVCADTFREQLEFRRSGGYTLKEFAAAREQVYDNSAVMEYYIDGLLLTQVLWENHWALMRFARGEFFAPYCLTSSHHLEVGPGHGYFTVMALRFGAGRVTAYDVSEQSLRHTADMLETQGFAAERWQLHHQDVQRHIPLADGSVDTVVSGEVLEHIEDPAALLGEIRRVLAPGGAVLITTCANAPAIDHLSDVASADEIREVIAGAGLELERDLAYEAGRIGDKPLINYAAVLRKGAR